MLMNGLSRAFEHNETPQHDLDHTGCLQDSELRKQPKDQPPPSRDNKYIGPALFRCQLPWSLFDQCLQASQPPTNELTFQRQSNDYVGQAEEFQPFIQCKWGVQVHMGHMHIHAVVPKKQFPMHHATCILTYIFTYIQPVQTISAMSMVWLG